MSKYMVGWRNSDGDLIEEPDVFDTVEDAEDYINYLRSCAEEGAEILYMSNPYENSPEVDELDYEVVEIDD